MPDVEEQIRRAMLAGKFSDLPGKGKPLHLDDNPHASPEWRLAYHLLQSNGYPLPWIERRREIEQGFELAYHNLRRGWIWRSTESASRLPSDQIETEWLQAAARFMVEVQRLNKLIRDYNLQAPADNLQLPLIQPQLEIERLTTEPLSDRL